MVSNTGNWPLAKRAPEIWLVQNQSKSHDFGGMKIYLPSGKHTKNYGKSPLFMGKSTINGPFSITRPGKHTKNYGKIHHAINGKNPRFQWQCSIAM